MFLLIFRHEILYRLHLHDQQHNYVNGINESGSNLLRILDEILDVSKFETDTALHRGGRTNRCRKDELDEEIGRNL